MRYQLLDSVVRKSASKATWATLQEEICVYNLQGYTYGVFVLLKKYFKTSIPHSFFRAIRPSRFKLSILKYKIAHTDIFSQDNRFKAGIERFILIFFLSPEPIWKKMLLFIYPEVIFTPLVIVWRRVTLLNLGSNK